MDCVWADHLNYFPIMLSEMRETLNAANAKIITNEQKLSSIQSQLGFIRANICDQNISNLHCFSKLFFFVVCEILKSQYKDVAFRDDGNGEIDISNHKKYLIDASFDKRVYFYISPTENGCDFDTWEEACQSGDADTVGEISYEIPPIPYSSGGYSELEFYFIIRSRSVSSLLQDVFNSIVPNKFTSSTLTNILGNFMTCPDFSQIVSKSSLFQLLLKDILINQHTNFLVQSDIANTHSRKFLEHLLNKAKDE